MGDRCINRGLRTLLQATDGRVLVLPGRALARRVGVRVALAGTHVDGCDRRRCDGEREPTGQAQSRDLTTHMSLPSYEGSFMRTLADRGMFPPARCGQRTLCNPYQTSEAAVKAAQ